MPQGLAVSQAMEFERISRREVFYRLRSGELRRLPDRSIDLASLTLDAQARWKAAQLAGSSRMGGSGVGDASLAESLQSLTASPRSGGSPTGDSIASRTTSRVTLRRGSEAVAAPAAFLPSTHSAAEHSHAAHSATVHFGKGVPAASSTPVQGDLYWAEQIAALSTPAAQKDVVQRRMDLVRQAINGNWRAAGYARKRDFRYELAERNRVSGRTLERWIARLSPTITAERPDGDASALLDRPPGPAPGDPRALEPWARAWLLTDYCLHKFNMRQCYEKLLAEIRRKQESPGWRVAHLYAVPSYWTVRRYLNRLDPTWRALREGADAMKAAAGYIERSYADLHSLDRVETDEWICDAYAYDPSDARKVGRYYLLTFLDARSIYPLNWSLVEHPDEQAEIELFTALARAYGLPRLIHSDRGRFRGKTFGGKFLSYDRDGGATTGSGASQASGSGATKLSGIFDRLKIRRNMGREHNPRGSRLERFHKELATFFRTLPGWVGANTFQRKAAPGDRHRQMHELWLRGKLRDDAGRSCHTPLLSRDELLEQISQFMARWRERPSEGRDMRGLAPAAVFENNRPLGGFRRVSEEELAWSTAEHFVNELIEPGGIVQLPDKRRYSHPLLLLIQGQRRECVRLRHNKTFISVLPERHRPETREEPIFAQQRTAVGSRDTPAVRAALSAACEEQARIRKILGLAAEAAGQSAAVHRVEAFGLPTPSTAEAGADARPAGAVADPRLAGAGAHLSPAIPRATDAEPAGDFFHPQIATAQSTQMQSDHSRGVTRARPAAFAGRRGTCCSPMTPSQRHRYTTTRSQALKACEHQAKRIAERLVKAERRPEAERPAKVESRSTQFLLMNRATQRSFQLLDRVAAGGVIGMAIAHPGVAKSYSIKCWRRKHSGVRNVWMEAYAGARPRQLLYRLAEGLGLEPKAAANSDALRSRICERLADDPVLVILDEADLVRVMSFDLLRSIWDQVAEMRDSDGESAFPLALYGTPRLAQMLMREDLERLRRRVSETAILPPMNEKETALALEGKWPRIEFDAEAVRELHKLSRGSFGWLNRIVPIAEKIANKAVRAASAQVVSMQLATARAAAAPDVISSNVASCGVASCNVTARIVRETPKYLVGLERPGE